jgi:hypothetical protein
MNNKWKLLADEIVVWNGSHQPSQNTINNAYENASNRGWNGTQLEVTANDNFVCFVSSTADA